MIFEALLVTIGFGGGYYYSRRDPRPVIELKQRVATLERRSKLLSEENSKLNATLSQSQAVAKREHEDRERRKQYSIENSLSDAKNQIRFIQNVSLYPSKPVNVEASVVLYALEEWIRSNRPKWRMSFEVSMGAFIRTDYDTNEQSQKSAFSSYNSKRVDFLVIDERGLPRFVVEYHGSGHDLSGDAADRMAVKRLALSRAGIPLVEVPERTNKQNILRMINEVLAVSA